MATVSVKGLIQIIISKSWMRHWIDFSVITLVLWQTATTKSKVSYRADFVQDIRVLEGLNY